MTAATHMPDGIKWWPTARIEKWESETLRELTHEFNLTQEPNSYTLEHLKKKYGAEPTKILEVEGNLLVNTGRVRTTDLLIANGTPKQLTSVYGGTGVGDNSGSVAAAVTQTSLQGTNTLYKPLDGAPTDGTTGSNPGVITAQTTYQTSDANFAWNEWCLVISTATTVSSSSFATATTSGIMLNRAVTSLGTKVNTAVWVLQVTVTLS